MSIFNLSKGLPYLKALRSFVLGVSNASYNSFIPRRRSSDFSVREVKIDVPWGHIAGRLWNGSDNRIPVICIHGWKDNASTFDRLMPLLIPSLHQYQFLCIDLPGHGFSSHYPPGMIYNLADCYTWIRRIMRSLDWQKVTIIGHSLGGIIGFTFTSFFPKAVEQLVAIDGLTPIIFSTYDILETIPFFVDDLISMDESLTNPDNIPTFTREEIYEKLIASHLGGLNEIACKTLMTRGIVEHPLGSGRFRFSHDIRVQHLPVTTLNNRQISYQAKNFQSGLLHIKAAEGVNYMSTFLETNMQNWIERGNKKHVQFVRVEKAAHHVHLMSPELLDQHIIEFLKNPRKVC